MPTAPKFEFPQGRPLFNTTWRAVSEANAGVGVLDTDDFEVTTTSTDLELDVAEGDLWYPPDEQDYSYGGGTFTLSEGDADNDRWDLVYYDTDEDDVDVREGTAETKPTVPDIEEGEVFLAYVKVEQDATDVNDDDVHNWRAMAQEAAAARFEGDGDHYSAETVEKALVEDLIEAVQLSEYPIVLDDLDAPYPLGDITDRDLDGDDLDDSAGPGTIYDASEEEVVQSVLGGPAADLSGYPIPNDDLDEDYAIVPVSLSDLDAPFPLPDITDRDLDGDDLNDDAGPGTIYDASEEEVVQSVLGGPAADLSGYPIPDDDLDAPYPLGDITDRDLDGDDLDDSAGPGTIYDASEGELSPDVVPDEDLFYVSDDVEVQNGDYRILTTRRVDDGEEFHVRRLHALGEDAGPLPTDVDVTISTFDDSGGNQTTEETVFEGDGSDISEVEDVTYENTSGSTQTVALTGENESGGAEFVTVTAVCELR